MISSPSLARVDILGRRLRAEHSFRSGRQESPCRVVQPGRSFLCTHRRQYQGRDGCIDADSVDEAPSVLECLYVDLFLFRSRHTNQRRLHSCFFSDFLVCITHNQRLPCWQPSQAKESQKISTLLPSEAVEPKTVLTYALLASKSGITERWLECHLPPLFGTCHELSF